ncbi:hypothetical protein [Nocardioides sp.]|uniref:hypothetical protein n=1 Tax=Nocardioides sp. TaxID=35761 RepID=UPI00356AFFB2
MTQIRGRVVPVLLAAVVLIGAANLAAYAVTGKPLLLGKANTAAKTTTLKAGNGPALKLKTRANKPPLKVTSKVKVKKFNADLLDGTSAADLETTARTYRVSTNGAVASNALVFGFPGLPAGDYLVSTNISLAIAGNPTSASCYLVSEPDYSYRVMDVADTDGASWFHSASGMVSVKGGEWRLLCQRTGGTATTIPAQQNFPHEVIFVPVKNTSTAATRPRPTS